VKAGIACLAAMILALAACVPRPATLTPPDTGWGETFLVVIELGEGTRHPTKSYVPPECRSANQICLDGTIMEHQARLERVVASSSDRPFPRRIFDAQTIGPHAGSRMDGGMVLALAERTRDGYWWIPWYARPEAGRACIPNASMAQFGIVLTGAATQRGEIETCLPV